MNDMNNVNLIGRLTKDPTLEYSSNGFAIMKFSIAVNRSRKKGGEWIDEASFFDCTLLGNQAAALKQYMTKGKQIGVEGFLHQDRWQSQDGTNHSRVTIGCTNVQLLGGNSGNGGNYAANNDGNYGGDADYGFNS